MDLLKQAASLAVKAAGAARSALPMSSIPSAKDATAMLEKATGMAGKLGVIDQQAASRALGAIKLSTGVMGKSPLDAVRSAGALLGAAQGKAAKAFGAALSSLPGAGAISSSSLGSLFGAGDAPAAGWQLEVAADDSKRFRFALGQAAYDELRRRSQYVLSAQDRLAREAAVQATSVGGETLSVSGAVFLAAHGAGHIDALRAIGSAMKPVTLTTGYGELLGRWYIASIDDAQAHLFRDGAPRKQTYTIEFTRYGEDYKNL